MNRKKSLMIFIFLTVPIYFFVIIKDHFMLFAFYIGLFLLSLIFFSYFFEKKLQKVFFISHFNLLNTLILQIKSGYSAQKALSESFQQMNSFEKIIYSPLKTLLKPDFDVEGVLNKEQRFYFSELRTILMSQTRLIEQLEMYKRGLKVKIRFIERSHQVSRQIKAQAVVATFIYVLIFAMSYFQLNLGGHLAVICCSLVLFILGLVCIFRIGGHIKWKI